MLSVRPSLTILFKETDGAGVRAKKKGSAHIGPVQGLVFHTLTEKTRVNAFQHIGAAEDTHRMTVSTTDDSITGRKVTVEDDSPQWMSS